MGILRFFTYFIHLFNQNFKLANLVSPKKAQVLVVLSNCSIGLTDHRRKSGWRMIRKSSVRCRRRCHIDSTWMFRLSWSRRSDGRFSRNGVAMDASGRICGARFHRSGADWRDSFKWRRRSGVANFLLACVRRGMSSLPISRMGNVRIRGSHL